MEILTVNELAAMLKISKSQVYKLAKQAEKPIPSIRIRTSVRFRKSDVEGWVGSGQDRVNYYFPTPVSLAGLSKLFGVLILAPSGEEICKVPEAGPTTAGRKEIPI